MRPYLLALLFSTAALAVEPTMNPGTEQQELLITKENLPVLHEGVSLIPAYSRITVVDSGKILAVYDVARDQVTTKNPRAALKYVLRTLAKDR